MNVVIGKKGAGNPYLLNLSNMSPILIDGETRSGKSHLVSIILSELTKQFNPGEMKLCLMNPIDFKEDYENSPYLMAQIARSIDEIIALLTLIDQEMRQRYYMFSLYNAKNFEDYQKKGNTSLPYIVVVFEEFGVLTQTDKQVLEPRIIFLAQMSKATGIYIILNTMEMATSDTIRKFINTFITTLGKGRLEIKLGRKHDVVKTL